MSSAADANGWMDVSEEEEETLLAWETRELQWELWLQTPQSHWPLAIALVMLVFQAVGSA